MGAKLNRYKSTQTYQTPPEFLAALKVRLGIDDFTIDLAASAENKVAPLYYDEATDALKPEMPWKVGDLKGWAFCNPPFGSLGPWVEKACEESRGHGAKVAMLVPASVGANWWSMFVHNIAEVLLLNGRITFVGASDPYPKDTAILLYDKYWRGGYDVWNWREDVPQ